MDFVADRLTVKRLLNWIALRPYGYRLSTEGASFWILSARIIVLIMAGADAVSWSYLGYHIGRHSWFSWLTATGVGIAMFLIIWVLDSTFLTVDTARPYYDKILNGKDEDAAWLERCRLGGGLLLRVVIYPAHCTFQLRTWPWVCSPGMSRLASLPITMR